MNALVSTIDIRPHYDIDLNLLEYARWLYPKRTLTHSIKEATSYAPYDIILANCCFHHISDSELISSTLPEISSMMHKNTIFILIDILPLENNASLIRRAYNKLEAGHSKRCAEHLEKLLLVEFTIINKCVERSHLLSLDSKANPIYNDLIIFALLKKGE